MRFASASDCVRPDGDSGEVGEVEPRGVLTQLDDVGALDHALVDGERDARADRTDEKRDLVLVDELLGGRDTPLIFAL